MELSGINIKIFLIFSKKKAFLIFWEMKLSYIFGNEPPSLPPPPKKKIYFRKYIYILGNGNPE